MNAILLRSVSFWSWIKCHFYDLIYCEYSIFYQFWSYFWSNLSRFWTGLIRIWEPFLLRFKALFLIGLAPDIYNNYPDTSGCKSWCDWSIRDCRIFKISGPGILIRAIRISNVLAEDDVVKSYFLTRFQNFHFLITNVVRAVKNYKNR